MYFSTITAAAIFSVSVAALPAGSAAPDAFCLAICYLQEPTCEDYGFAKKEENSPCWTCCSDKQTPAPPPPTDAFCQAICYLTEPTCEGGMLAKKEDNSPCWTCCKGEQPSVPGAEPVPTQAPGCPAH